MKYVCGFVVLCFVVVILLLSDHSYDIFIRVFQPLQWRHNGHNGISNHQPHHCLLSRLFRCRSKRASKLHVTGLCAGNSPVTSEFPAQMSSKGIMLPFDDVIMHCFTGTGLSLSIRSYTLYISRKLHWNIPPCNMSSLILASLFGQLTE